MSSHGDYQGQYHDNRDDNERSRRKRHMSFENRDPMRNDDNDAGGATSDYVNPELLRSRIYIRFVTPNMNSSVVRERFSKYGKILDLKVHYNNAYVQYETEECAQAAVANAMYNLMRGQIISVNMSSRNESVVPRERESWDPNGPPHRDRSPHRDSLNKLISMGRNRSEFDERDSYDYSHRWNGPPEDNRRLPPPVEEPFYERHREDEPMRDSYDYSHRWNGPPEDDRRLAPPVEEPFYERRREDEHMRPDSFEDVNRNREPPNDWKPNYPDNNVPLPEGGLAPPRPHLDASIMITSPQLRDYADHLRRRLENFNMAAEICVLPEDQTQNKIVEDKARQGVLYIIILIPQNEVHRSLTLHIFQGTPQEHRNMPLADAMNLVARNFERYLQQLKEENNSQKPTASSQNPNSIPPSSVVFEPPSTEIRYLLDLLADSRHLTIEELDKILLYVSNRKKVMLPAETPDGRSGFIAKEERPVVDNQLLLLQQQSHPNKTDFESKILSMIAPVKSSDGNPGNVPSPSIMGKPHPQVGTDLAIHAKGDAPPRFPANSSSNMTALINFDNPTVKKALDNLIQSGPSLLQSISAAAKGLPSQERSENLPRDGGKGSGAPPMGNPQAYPTDRIASQRGSRMPGPNMNPGRGRGPTGVQPFARNPPPFNRPQ